MVEILYVYVFRDFHFVRYSDTIVCIVERKQAEKFISKKELDWAFSGHATYVRWWPWRTYIGVYGRKNASRFRRFLRERGAHIVIDKGIPPKTRLFYFIKQKHRRKVRTLPPHSA